MWPVKGLRDWYRTSVSKFLYGIYLLYRRHCHIGNIYQVYTRYIPMSKYIPGLYQGCTWYIPGIYQVCTLMLVYTLYIFGIYLVYTNVTKLDTLWLVLRGRTGPHSSCSDISRPCDYSDFITPLAPTARILAPGHVSVKGALQTENSIYIPFLTSTAYETILYDGRCINVYDNGTDETVQANVKECWTVYLSTVN